ncbi:hypothetical protein CBOM_07500 [Ceraceosorus bombacis]|uniref:Uncharacterized protein n=1 Tax=Ceraceosorus bombacis TaxID=401625 RepID=A0A0N7L9K3_9BASI|nr:hypothetical protein CBOM_07500 [Ceraceosorus bombacis]
MARTCMHLLASGDLTPTELCCSVLPGLEDFHGRMKHSTRKALRGVCWSSKAERSLGRWTNQSTDKPERTCS